ncbi:hypothetical protein J1N35_042665 [Gossypium stocksii]|uniref:Agenet domain-containing protein n=1 Tax=Gossypium stocksii TaxID=47602 RepID=A0A9D3U5W7_9ROSI|nr:hypothetical protein J1N35_042665 [Gossypium stocksii]
MAMFFQGDEVEVCSKEEGFLGSYCQAKSLSPSNNNTLYRVQYKNLVEEEDQTRPLAEIVSANVEIRFESLKMSKLKSKEKVDDGDSSWLELLNGVKASTSSENEKLHKLTQMVLSKFVARLVTKMENKMMIKKEGIKSCHEVGVEEGK